MNARESRRAGTNKPGDGGRRPGRLGPALVGIGIVAAFTGILGFLLWPIQHTFYTDADTINQPEATAKVRDILWQPPTRLPGTINSGIDAYEPRLSADGMTLFFVRGKAGENANIHYCTRTPEGWTDPRPLVEVDTEYDELGPEPSADGRSLYFYSDRPGGFGGYDIWVVHRGLDGRSEFGEAINLGPLVNSEFNDYGPALVPARGGEQRRRDFAQAEACGSGGGEELYFASNRPQTTDAEQPDQGAWPGTIREDLFNRTYDLYVAPITKQGMGKAEAASGLNTPYNEGAPAVSPFGDFLYFASDRPGGEGGFDLYRSRLLPIGCENSGARGSDQLSLRHPQGVALQACVNLGVTINTPANELDPGLTLGGYGLYFSSNRAAAATGIGAEKLHASVAPPLVGGVDQPYAIYRTTSREVFTTAETCRTSVDWVAIWSGVGPNLLWALLALLLLLLMLGIARGTKSRRLSLLARCVLASLAAHMLLMLLFNVWEVTATLARELGGRGRIQIALVAPARGDEIISQIRGEFTSVDVPEQPASTVRRHAVEIKTESTPAITTLTVGPGSTVVEDRFELDRQAADAEHAPTFGTPDVTPSVPDSAPRKSLELSLPDETVRASQAEAALSVEPAPVPDPSIQRPPVSRVTRQRLATTPQASVAPDSSRVVSREEPPQSLAEAPPNQDAATATRFAAATTTEASARRHEALSLLGLPTLQLALPQAPRDRLNQDEPPALGSQVPTAHIEPPRRTSRAQSETGASTSQTRELEPVDSGSAAGESSLAESHPTRGADVTVVSSSVPAFDTGDLPVPGLPLARLSLQALEETEPAAHGERSSRLEGTPPEDVHRSLGGLAALSYMSLAPSVDLSPGKQGVAHVDAEFPSQERAVPKDVDVRTLSSQPPLADTSPDSPRTAFALHSLSLQLPAELTPPDPQYGQRSPDRRMNIVEDLGGGEQTEQAVQLALQWLAKHQSADGRWDGDGFDEECGKCGGQTSVEVDIALTGLSLLCFLAADHTHTKAGAYRDNVERGLRWLTAQQKLDGDLRRFETMYSQGIATIALAEAYGMTRDSRLHDPVQRAVRFIERARNGRTGIWRYDPGQPGDTSVLGWQIMALKSAHSAGLEVSMARQRVYNCFNAARHWLDTVSSPGEPGLYAYQPGRERTPSMTAEGLFIQLMLGRPREEPRMQQSVAFILDHLPDWDDQPNTYYWYYATLAMFHHQGEPWHRWNAPLTEELLAHQRTRGRPAGSWDPKGEWAHVGGRVYQTALCTLMLEVYYRYLPLFMREMPAEAIGTVRGNVRDAETGTPLHNATVRLDLPDRAPLEATTSAGGEYVLHTPEVPAFFALSASSEGYLPISKNVATAMVRGTTLELDFELQSETQSVVAIEAVPDVHHLGDDSFSGAINSQSQKQSEGASFSASFLLAPAQLPPYRNAAELTMLVKGVQYDHRIYINGHLIEQRLDRAPRDGSFGTFRTALDPTLLMAGTNTIEINAMAVNGDVDDFEFVNLQIRFLQ